MPIDLDDDDEVISSQDSEMTELDCDDDGHDGSEVRIAEQLCMDSDVVTVSQKPSTSPIPRRYARYAHPQGTERKRQKPGPKPKHRPKQRPPRKHKPLPPVSARDKAIIAGVLAGKGPAQALVDASEPGHYSSMASAASTANWTLSRPNLRKAMLRAFNAAGATPKHVAMRLAECMNANRIGQDATGAPVELGPDSLVRLRAMSLWSKMVGADAPKQDELEIRGVLGLIHMPAKAPRATPPIEAIEAVCEVLADPSREKK